MRKVMFALMFVASATLLSSRPAVAQGGPCTDSFVRSEAAKQYPSSVADDMYFFSGAIEKPIVGTAAAKRALGPVDATRKNQKYDPVKIDRIVAAPSGEMAYEYGTEHISFDQRDTGKNIDFTAAYLRVWRAEGGSCKLAAEMFEPQEGK